MPKTYIKVPTYTDEQNAQKNEEQRNKGEMRQDNKEEEKRMKHARSNEIRYIVYAGMPRKRSTCLGVSNTTNTKKGAQPTILNQLHPDPGRTSPPNGGMWLLPVHLREALQYWDITVKITSWRRQQISPNTKVLLVSSYSAFLRTMILSKLNA